MEKLRLLMDWTFKNHFLRKFDFVKKKDNKIVKLKKTVVWMIIPPVELFAIESNYNVHCDIKHDKLKLIDNIIILSSALFLQHVYLFETLLHFIIT